MSLTQVTYAGVPCYQYVDDSLDLTKPVNVMLQLPGEGESVAPITLLSKYLATGTLTATSKKGMVIIEGQPGVSWGLDVAQLQAFISAIQAAFKVNALALAGYSIGGQQWANWAESAEANFAQVSAFYYASADTENAAPYGTAVFNAALYAKYKVRDVRACGTNDAGFYSTQLAKATAITAAKPLIPNVFIPYVGSGHDGSVWTPFFSISSEIVLLNNGDIYTDFNTYFPVAAAPVVVAPPAGLQLPSATSDQLATITPTAALAYYNSTTGKITVGNGTIWQ